MMGWLKQRLRLSSLVRQERNLYAKGQREIDAAIKRGIKGDDLRGVEYFALHDAEEINDEISHLESMRLVKKARSWGVPVPAQIDGDDWRQSSTLGTWSLTEACSMKLRREIAIEVEIAQKPWLNWSALVVSLISLAVAIVALVFKP